MIDTKQKAKDILEEYANCYSQVDLERLVKNLDDIKSEAIKEFADGLKKQFKEDINDIQDSITRITDPDAIDGQYETIATFELSLDYIDNLVKKWSDTE